MSPQSKSLTYVLRTGNSYRSWLKVRRTFFGVWLSEAGMKYPGYEFLVQLHVYLMRDIWHETLYGPTRPELLESALARPRQAAYYDRPMAFGKPLTFFTAFS
jgi:hypothetical protein